MKHTSLYKCQDIYLNHQSLLFLVSRLVEYSVDGFMEKNRDELPKAGADLLLSSTNEFIKIIATEMINPAVPSAPGKKQLASPRGGASQRPTVGIQFSAQLHDLRRKIDETSPHCELTNSGPH